VFLSRHIRPNKAHWNLASPVHASTAVTWRHGILATTSAGFLSMDMRIWLWHDFDERAATDVIVGTMPAPVELTGTLPDLLWTVGIIEFVPEPTVRVP
jgi:hypothetical protein